MNTKKMDIIATLALVGLIALSYFGLVNRMVSNHRFLVEQERTLGEDLSSKNGLDSGLESLRSEIKAVRRSLVEFDQRLPSSKEVDVFLMQINEIASKTGLELELIEPDSMVKESMYSRVPVALRAAAPFPDMYRFLYELNQIPRLCKIENLDVKILPKNGKCSIALNLSIFVSPDKGGVKEWFTIK